MRALIGHACEPLASRPLSLSRGVLVVAVSDPAWATQLTYLEGDLVARFRDALGEGVVQRVEVRQRRV